MTTSMMKMIVVRAADVGPAPEVIETSPYSDYKLLVFWDAWSSQVQNKIIRDLILLSRLALTNKTRLLVAADKALEPYAKLCGVAFTDNFDKADLVRVYIQQGRSVPDDVYARIPEDVPYDIVPLTHKLPHIDRKMLNPTPYADMQLAPLGKRIPPTINIHQPPPKGIGDQIWQNFF